MLPGVAVKLLGTVGTATGVTFTLAIGPVPTLFTARTQKVYNVPLSSPENVGFVLLDAAAQDAPLLRDT